MGFGRRKSRPSRQVIYAPSGRLGLSAITARPLQGAPVVPPAAPGSVVVTAPISSQVNLSWVDLSSTETRFAIQRALNGGFTSGLQTFYTINNSYSDTTVAAATAYYYRVRAEDQTQGLQSAWTNANTFPVTTPTVVPGSGAVPEVLAVHPRLGFTDVVALRTRVVDPAYAERTHLQSMLAGTYWANPLAETPRNAMMVAINAAYVCALGPEALSAAGITVPASINTTAKAAQVAYDCLTLGSPSALGLLMAPNEGCAGASYSVAPHYISNESGDWNHCAISAALVFDWCYANLTPAQRTTLLGVAQNYYTYLIQPGTFGWLIASDGWISGNQGNRAWIVLLLFMAMFNETEWPATQQQAAWAVVQSVLNNRYGYESQALGVAQYETNGGGYGAEEVVNRGFQSLLMSPAFIGTSPMDSWPYFDATFADYGYQLAFPHQRGTTLPDYTVGQGVIAFAYEYWGPRAWALLAQRYLARGMTAPAQIAAMAVRDSGADYADSVKHDAVVSYLIQPWTHLANPAEQALTSHFGQGISIWQSALLDPNARMAHLIDTTISTRSTQRTFGILANGQLVVCKTQTGKSFLEFNSPAAAFTNGWVPDGNSGITFALVNPGNTAIAGRGTSAGLVAPYVSKRLSVALSRGTTTTFGYAAHDWRDRVSASYADQASTEMVVLHRSDPSVVFRYDRVNRISGATGGRVVRMFNWVPAQPTWSGGTQTQKFGTPWWVESTDAQAVQILNQGPAAPTTATWREGATNGRLWLTPVLPAGRVIAARGGTETNPTTNAQIHSWQYPFDTTTDSISFSETSIQSTTTAGHWPFLQRLLGWGRVEIIDPTDALSPRFLQVYEYGNATTFTTRTPVVGLTPTTGAWDGAHYQHATNEVIVWFKRDATTSTLYSTSSLPLEYTWTRASALPKHIVANLPKSGTVYVRTTASTVRIESAAFSGAVARTVTSTGVLSFTVDAAGTYGTVT